MDSYENPWIYLERPFTGDDVRDNFGFVYKITNLLNGRSYIGRKYFWSFRTPPGKKRKVKQESDWKKYYGSCPELKEDIKKTGNKVFFKREILSLHKTKGTCNYEETKQLFLNNVLSESLDNGSPAYYNSNILGRYMRKDYGNFRGHSAEST
jgi:ribosome maturation factor RimP